MIKVNTLRFGELSIKEDKIITFKDGIPGFPESRRFIILDHRDTPLKWLQSIDEPELAFLIAEASVVDSNYKVNLDKSVLDYLEFDEKDDVVIFLILRVEDGKVIANFNGPLVFNANKMLGAQVVIDRSFQLKPD